VSKARRVDQREGAVGFVGLGAMGAPMASRLLLAGRRLVVHDASEDRVRLLTEQGARAARTPREVADEAETVLVSLPSQDAVRAVLGGEDGLRSGSAMRWYVELSTTGPEGAAETNAMLDGSGVGCVDAPVSGGPAGAANGRLTIMVAGAARAIDAVRPLLEQLGSTICVIGEVPGQAQLVKVINNLLSASAIAITAEGAALAVKAGVDPRALLEAIATSSGSNTAVADKFPKQVLTRRFDHGFRLELMAKDVTLCLAEAQRHDVPMLLGSSVGQLWRIAARTAAPADDCTAIVKMFEAWAGTTIGDGAR
jgi:3-hydroxyisobutyrate dehydrogenase-like beta-hydroxyacid dehydrogenase